MASKGIARMRKWFRNDTADIIRSGGFPLMPGSFGKAFFVNPDHARATDTNNPGTNPDKPLSTFAAGYSKMTTNKDDVLFLSSVSTHTLTAMTTVAKNRCHFVGMGPLREYGQGAKVSLGVTTAATDIGTILVTGVRNSFTNIKFINNNTVAEGIYCFIDGGEYTVLDHCEVYKSTDMDVTGAADFVANGDSGQYRNCTFGSLATARSGAVIRAAVLFTKGLAAAGKVARDNLFRECNFWINCANTANRFIYGANATDIERTAVFDRCNFINNGAAAAVPAENVDFGAALTVGNVLLNRCSSVNAATAMGTQTGIFVDGGPPTAGTTGISVQAT